MDADCIRLTSYLTGRRRPDDGRPLDGLSASQAVAASIALRGVDGSTTAIAVGFPLDVETAELALPGLVTVERTRLLTGEVSPARLGVAPGEATRLTVYCSGQDQVYLVPAFEAVCELLYRRGIAGASVLPGVDRATPGERRRPHLPHRGSGAPLMAVAVDPGDKLAMIVPEVGALFRHPVMTVEKVQVCKRDGRLISRPQPISSSRLKLTVYVSEAARHGGHLTHRAIARELEAAGIAAVTTVRGIWGFRADRPPHGDHFPHRVRHIPAVTTVIAAPEQAAAAFDVIDTLTTERGLVTAETVTVLPPAAALPQHGYRPILKGEHGGGARRQSRSSPTVPVYRRQEAA